MKKEIDTKEFKKNIKQLYLGVGSEFIGVSLIPWSDNKVITVGLVTITVTGLVLAGLSTHSLIYQYEESLKENKNLRKQLKQKK